MFDLHLANKFKIYNVAKKINTNEKGGILENENEKKSVNFCLELCNYIGCVFFLVLP
jgi:hypothetical protein